MRNRPDVDPMRYLDNGVLRIGIDLTRGGSITYLSRSGTADNVVNSYDLGRQIQMSHYGGPVPFTPGGRQPNPVWRGLGWNPIQSGDCAGHPSRILKCETHRARLTVQCQPMQWPLDNVPGDCTFTVEISLKDNTAEVRCHLENRREDRTAYPARDQELPAVYTNGPYHHLMTYVGDHPFANDKLVEIPNVGPPWARFTATESWAALVDDKGFGLGVWNEGAIDFLGGFAGKRGSGGPHDPPTGYIAPLRVEILDPDIVYEYRYTLILGPLEEIRHTVMQRAGKPGSPDYRFERDRAHWRLGDGAIDIGWPLRGSWNIRLKSTDGKPPQIIGPTCFWMAEQAPRLILEAAFPAGVKGETAVHWCRRDAQNFDESRKASIPIIGDGRMRKYTVDLSAHPEYRGIITGLLIDPRFNMAEGFVRLKRICLTK